MAPAEVAETRMLCEAAPAPMMADIDYCMAAPTPPRARKGRPGRIASLFRLNRVKYDEMKEDGGKTEF